MKKTVNAVNLCKSKDMLKKKLLYIARSRENWHKPKFNNFRSVGWKALGNYSHLTKMSQVYLHRWPVDSGSVTFTFDNFKYNFSSKTSLLSSSYKIILFFQLCYLSCERANYVWRSFLDMALDFRMPSLGDREVSSVRLASRKFLIQILLIVGAQQLSSLRVSSEHFVLIPNAAVHVSSCLLLQIQARRCVKK